MFSLLVYLGIDHGSAGELVQHLFVWLWGVWPDLRSDDERAVTCYRRALVWGRAAVGQRISPQNHGDGLVGPALRGLPEEERVAVVLSRIAGLSPEQVAQVLHASNRQVRSVRRRAWSHLAAVLGPRSGADE